jgi:glyoxylase-like metal-dependent hydrolase (beta-lactamase superfamily II)
MLAGQPLSAIVLTHTHFDHAGNAAELNKIFGCRLMVHGSEAGFLRAGYSPVPNGAVPATRFLNKLDKHKISFLVGTKPVEPDVLIGEEMDLGTFGIPVVLKHTPGHSPGSVSLVVDNDVAVVGDNMVNVMPGKIFPPFCDNVPDMFESWKKLLGTGCRIFLPSHGKEIPRALLEFSFLTQKEKWKQKHG